MNVTPSLPAGPLSVYTGRTTSWALVLATSFSGAVLVFMGAQSEGPWRDLVLPLGLAVVGVLLDVLTASSVRATAGPNGFTVRWGIIGWPRCTYPLAAIARAEVIDLSWTRVSWGFWWTPRRTCCTLRSGPTVRLLLHSGRRVTITVPEPHAAVAAINEAKARAAR